MVTRKRTRPCSSSSNKYSDSSKAGGICTGRKEGRGQPAAVAQTNSVCVVKRAVVKRAVVKRAGASRPPLLRLITYVLKPSCCSSPRSCAVYLYVFVHYIDRDRESARERER